MELCDVKVEPIRGEIIGCTSPGAANNLESVLVIRRGAKSTFSALQRYPSSRYRTPKYSHTALDKLVSRQH